MSGGSIGWSAGYGRKGNYWADDAQPGSSPLAIPLSITASGIFGSTNYQYNDSTKTLFFPGTQTFTYDDDGNMIGDGIWAYTYDAENRLIAMQSVAITGFPNKLLNFTYDYLNRRVEKKVGSWNGSTYVTSLWRRYVYDGDNLVAEFNASGGTTGTIQRSYAWGLDVSGSLGATGGVGALLQITDHPTNKSYFPTYDANGNIASLINASSGTVAASYEYSPFGELLRRGGPTYLGADSTILDSPFGFSTKFTDWETGLVYYGARYYSPSLGRFINRDPIEEAGGLNLYGFCGNDGMNRYDVLGFSWLSRALKALRHASYDIARAFTPIASVRRMWSRMENWEDSHQRELTIAAAIVASIVTYGAASDLAMSAMGTTSGGLTTYSIGGTAISASTAGTISSAVGGFASGVVSGVINGESPQTVLRQGLIGGVVAGTIYATAQYINDTSFWNKFRAVAGDRAGATADDNYIIGKPIQMDKMYIYPVGPNPVTAAKGGVDVYIGYTEINHRAPAAIRAITAHSYVFFHNSKNWSEQWALRAGPEPGQPGRMYAQTDVYSEGFWDKPSETFDIQYIGHSDMSYQAAVQYAKDYTNTINIEKLAYVAFDPATPLGSMSGQNSNSFAFSFVRSLGFENAKPTIWRSVPGFARGLPGPSLVPR